MLASELLDAVVQDSSGQAIGRLRDVRFALDGDRYRATGIVIGHSGPAGAIAHGWGFAEGRADGPWLLRALLARGSREARFVHAHDVLEWSRDGAVVLREGHESEPLRA